MVVRRLALVAPGPPALVTWAPTGRLRRSGLRIAGMHSAHLMRRRSPPSVPGRRTKKALRGATGRVLAMPSFARLGSDYDSIRKRVVRRASLRRPFRPAAHVLPAGVSERLCASYYVGCSGVAGQRFLSSHLFQRVVDAFARAPVRTSNVLRCGPADPKRRPCVVLCGSRRRDSMLDGL